MTHRPIPGYEDATIRSMADNQELAGIIRTIMTFYGVHKGCTFRVCRRARACATRDAVCYQAMGEEARPIVASIMARHWARLTAEGSEFDVAPAREGDMRRLIAWEDAEIERMRSGTPAPDDYFNASPPEGSAYWFYLRSLMREADGKAKPG